MFMQTTNMIYRFIFLYLSKPFPFSTWYEYDVSGGLVGKPTLHLHRGSRTGEGEHWYRFHGAKALGDLEGPRFKKFEGPQVHGSRGSRCVHGGPQEAKGSKGQVVYGNSGRSRGFRSREV